MIKTVEEKAKAYDEAKERARLSRLQLLDIGEEATEIEYIFPELRESEDERVRKALIRYFTLSDGHAYNEACGVSYRDIVAWLEKQKTSDEALQYLKENHSPSEVSDFQAAMNIAVAKAYDKGYNDGFKKQGEQKPAWSEEDAKLWLHDDDIFLDAAKVIVGDSPRRSYGGVHKKEIVPWLFSLKERLKAVKDRVQSQPKQEWSKEDEEHIDSLLKRLEGMCKPDATFTSTGFAISEDEDWLKSLKYRVQPQSQWKPSEQDILLLERIFDGKLDPRDFQASLLSIIGQLKKLKG